MLVTVCASVGEWVHDRTQDRGDASGAPVVAARRADVMRVLSIRDELGA